MANMTYCRWENTLNALNNCIDSVLDIGGSFEEYFKCLSTDEKHAMIGVLTKAAQITELLEEENTNMQEWKINDSD